MLDHVSIQCEDPAASATFYDAVLPTTGGGRVMDFGEVIGYGIGGKPDFWIGPHNTGTGFHEVGTRNLYLLAPGGMAAAQQWLVQTWDTALAAYAAEVAQLSQAGKERPSTNYSTDLAKRIAAYLAPGHPVS